MPRVPIVEEIRKHREEYAARFSYDVKAICREAREHQKKSGRRTVPLPSRRVARTDSLQGIRLDRALHISYAT